MIDTIPKEMYLNWLFRVNSDTTRKLHQFETPQPFEDYGYDVYIATAGDGQNYEFYDQDTIANIGTVEISRLSGKIVRFVEYDLPEEMPDEVISRMYDPALGRFWQVDPMADERNWLTPYNFVQNNPITRIDPTGMLDDYYIYEDGTIERQITEGNTDTFYHVDKDNNVTDLGTFEKNENGLIQLPSTYSIDEVNVSFGFEVKGGQTERAYVSPESMASLFGAFAETGYTDFTITQFSYSDGTSPKPSVSHRNGNNGDFRYLRYDQSGSAVTVDNTQFDQARNSNFTSALNRFGYTDLKSYRYNGAWNSMLLPETTHLRGHHNHLHLQGYNPRITNVKLPATFYIYQSLKFNKTK